MNSKTQQNSLKCNGTPTNNNTNRTKNKELKLWLKVMELELWLRATRGQILPEGAYDPRAIETEELDEEGDEK